MKSRLAVFIAGLVAVAGTGVSASSSVAAAPWHHTVIAATDRDRDADDSRIPCAKLLDAYNRLRTAKAALDGVLGDLPRTDSAYQKLAYSREQVDDGFRTMQSRLSRNKCPM